MVYQQGKIENIKQMLDALEHLEKVSNEVFSRIEKKVAEQKAKLDEFQKRTKSAQVRLKFHWSTLTN